MKFTVAPEVFERLPDVCFGAVAAYGRRYPDRSGERQSPFPGRRDRGCVSDVGERQDAVCSAGGGHPGQRRGMLP